MNTRIKEIAEQATDFVDIKKNTDLADDMDIESWVELYNQKFAELIIKDCAEIVRNSLLPSQNKVPATVALDIAARNIELLFGVEK